MNSIRHYQQQIERLCKLLKETEGAKTLAERAQSLTETQELLSSIQWLTFSQEIAKNAAACTSELEGGLKNRREQLLLKLEAANLPVRRHGEYDRVGPFRVCYEKSRIVLKVGSVLERARSDEVDGEKLVAWIRPYYEQAVAPMTDFVAFAKLLRTGVEQARAAGQIKSDGWLNLKVLYREVWLARCRESFSGKGMKPPSPKEYQLVDFVIDLAKWLQGDRSIPGGKLKLRAPSMGQNDEAIMIPSIAAPWAEDLTLEAKLEPAAP